MMSLRRKKKLLKAIAEAAKGHGLNHDGVEGASTAPLHIGEGLIAHWKAFGLAMSAFSVSGG
jgi:hypothetical protein